MKMLIDRLRRGYELLAVGATALQSPFLLLLRLYFFWQLFLTGKGKLTNIGKVSEFFTSLGIPLPTLNAYFIGSLECFGSLLLIIGLAPVASDRDLDGRSTRHCRAPSHRRSGQQLPTPPRMSLGLIRNVNLRGCLES